MDKNNNFLHVPSHECNQYSFLLVETDRVKRMTVEISLDDIDLFSQSSLKSQSKPFLHSNSFNGLRKKKLSLVQVHTDLGRTLTKLISHIVLV